MNTIPVRMDKALFDSASIEGKAEFRSAAQQLNFWALVGKNALANPDLPVDFIRDILRSARPRPSWAIPHWTSC